MPASESALQYKELRQNRRKIGCEPQQASSAKLDSDREPDSCSRWIRRELIGMRSKSGMKSALVSEEKKAGSPLRVLFFEDCGEDIELSNRALRSSGFDV